MGEDTIGEHASPRRAMTVAADMAALVRHILALGSTVVQYKRAFQTSSRSLCRLRAHWLRHYEAFGSKC